jgi:hypothetical protein
VAGTRERTPLLHRLGAAASTLGQQPPRHPLVRIAVQGGLTALVLGFLIFTVIDQWHELQDKDVRFAALWLVPGVAALLAFQASAGFAWLLQLRLLGQGPRWVGSQAAWGKSLLARYVPGGLLFVVSRVVLTEREGVPRRVTLTAMAYETGLQFASAAAFAAWFLLAHPDRSDAWLGWTALAAVPISFALMHPRFFAPLATRMLKMFGRRGVPALLSPGQLVGLFLYYSATWAVMGAGMFCVARAIYPAAVVDWSVIAPAQALAFCAAVITLVFPGGLGIRDGAFAWAMKTTVPDHSFAVAAAVALTARIALSASEVIYAGAMTAAQRRSARRNVAPAPA